MKFPDRNLVVCALMLGAIGCGPAEHAGRVSGTIHCSGMPLPLGSVLFESPSAACIGAIVDGKFVLLHNDHPGIPPGVYRVSVLPPPPRVEADPQTTQLRTVSSADESLFPPAYRNQETSGLSFEVKAGANVFAIELSR